MKHLLSVDRPRRRRGDRAAGHRRPAQAGAAGPRGAQAADAARPHRDHDVLRELHPHPGVVRDRRQVDERGHGQRQRVRLVGRQGRVAARHRADPVRDGRGLRDRAAPGVRRGAPAGRVGGSDRERRARHRRSSTRATAPTSTPPRRCWTRPRCATASAASRGRRIGDRRRRAAQPGRPVQRAPARHAGRRGRAGGAARRCCRSGWRSGRAGSSPDAGRRAARPGRGDDAARAGRADARRRSSRRRASTRSATACPRTGLRAAARARRGAAPRADGARHGDRPGGRRRARRGDH